MRADDRIKDLNKQLDEDEAKLPDLKKKMEDAQKPLIGPPPMSPDDAQYADLKLKADAATHAYEDAMDRIHKIKDEDLPEAALQKDKQQLKAQEPMKGGGSLGGGQYSAAEQLGAGFLSGLFSDLGMGNVLGGKTPDKWAIVQLLGGLAGYGVGLGNAFLGGGGAAGGAGTGVGGGLAAGAGHALGLPNLPSIAKMAPFAAGPGQQHITGASPGPLPQGHGGGDDSQAFANLAGFNIDMSTHVHDNNFRDQGELMKGINDGRNSRIGAQTTIATANI
jgi:hypothetical protein